MTKYPQPIYICNFVSEITNIMSDKKEKTNYIGLGIALGTGIGTAIGVALDNIGMGIGVGIAIGVAIGTAIDQKNRKRDSENVDQ